MAFLRKTALLLVAVAVILAAWLAMPKAPTTRKTDRAAVRERPAGSASPRAMDENTRHVARARWEERRARIRAALAPRARDEARRSVSTPSRPCAEAECASDAAEHPSAAVFASFIEETTTLTQGCEELIEGKPASLRIQARLIGTPEIGTVVESLHVSGPVERVDALTECLMEGMYALEFGDAQTNFQRDAVLTLGMLDEVAGEGWLTPERLGEIRQQMIDGGLDPATDPMVYSEVDPATDPMTPVDGQGPASTP
jgi:hypothetical protein